MIPGCDPASRKNLAKACHATLILLSRKMLLLFIMVDATIHLIPKWRRPRMVWVELHDEASRAFYEATTGKWTDILRIQEKKTPKQRISLVAYMTSKSQGFSFGWIPSRDPYSTKIKVISIIDRAKCFHSFKVRDEPHNLKLALCIVSGEVEYAYCGPSCTAGKSGFFKLKITNILKSSGWGLETNELPCEENFLEP